MTRVLKEGGTNVLLGGHSVGMESVHLLWCFWNQDDKLL